MRQEKRMTMQCVLTLASDRVQEVDTTKCSGDQRIDLMTSTTDLQSSARADMWEDIALAKLNEGQFGVVAVCQEV